MALEPNEKNPNQELDDTAYNEWLRQPALPAEVVSQEHIVGDEVSAPRQGLGAEVGVVIPKSGFFYGWAKLLIVLVPLLFIIGYYSYDEVRASLTRIYSGAAAIPSLATTTIGVTITPDNLQEGLVGHFTFDGPSMDWASTTAEVEGSGLFNCGTDTVLDADSNVYNTLLIGSQCWMKQNMRVGTRISGATTQTNNSTIEKWCYSNSDANCTSNNPNQPDGGLYQWNEAMQYSTTPGAQGICPAGWHIPTHDELTTLERAVCTTGSCATDFPYDTTTTGYRGTTEGTKLKPSGSSGFEFNLAGLGGSGSFFVRASYGYLWSSSESGGDAWLRLVHSGNAQVYRYADGKTYGLSVRCLQDTNPTQVPRRGNAVNINQSNATMGKIGQAMRFDGVDDYISIPYQNLDFERTDPFTLSVWVKLEDVDTPGGAHGFFGRYQSNRGIIFGWCKNNIASVCNKASIVVQLSSNSSTNGIWVHTPTDSFLPGQWQNVVMTYDGSSNAGGVKIYIDGQNQTLTTRANTLTSTIRNTLNYRIGDDYTNDWVKGNIDDFRIYNRTLSSTEVAQLYSLGSGSTIKICNEASVQDADGNTYNTLAIGSQCWLDRNMNVGTRINAPTAQTNNGTIEKYCYSNSDANCTANNPNKPDGGLYHWNEAMQYSTTPGARGICPVGFHIPSDAEWHILEKFLLDGGASCSSTRIGYGCAPAGTKLQPGGNSLFEGNRAGVASYIGSFSSRTTNGNWWTSSSIVTGLLSRSVVTGEARLLRGATTFAGFNSIRCIQD